MRTSSLVPTVLSALTATSCAALTGPSRQNLYFERLHAQEASGQFGDYGREITSVRQGLVADVQMNCRHDVKRILANSNGVFIGIAVIGADGVTQDVIVFGEFGCTERHLKRLRLPAPPISPYYNLFRFNVRATLSDRLSNDGV